MHPLHPPGHGPLRRSTVAPVAAGLAGIGLALVVAATFLPWLTSGAVSRNSYEITGLAARLLFRSGTADVLLRAWTFVGPLCVLPFLLAAFRLWRTAGVVAAVLGLVAAGGGIVILVLGSGSDARSAGIALVATGPVVLTVGGAAALAGGLLLVLRRPRRAAVPPVAVPPAGFPGYRSDFPGIAGGVGQRPTGNQDFDTVPLPIRRTADGGHP
jgi:hypothetical protein